MLSQAQWDTALIRQRDLEDNCMSRGGERFKRRLRTAQTTGRTAGVGAAKRLLLNGIEPLEAGLREFITQAGEKRGPRHVAVKWIELLGREKAKARIEAHAKTKDSKDWKPHTPEHIAEFTAQYINEGIECIAYMTLKVILDGIDQRRSLFKVSNAITDLMTDELRYRRFQELAPGLFKYKMATFTTSSYSMMARQLNQTIKYADIDCSDLVPTQNHRALIGAKLIDLLIQTTGLVDVELDSTIKFNAKNRVNKKQQLMIVATPETLQWMSERNAILELQTPVNLPMVVPPLQWGPNEPGGYRFALRGKYPMVRGTSNSHRVTVNAAHIPLVYQAVNAIQNTAWKINTDVLDVIEDLMRAGGGAGGIPLTEPIEPPANPHDFKTNQVAKRAWKKAAHEVYDQNHRRVRDLVELNRRLDIVRVVRDDPAIFFPHNVDFRGRVYPVSTLISPQGDDMSKGLLTFAQGKAIGPDGGRWLAIHGANALGTDPRNDKKVSKMTLEERVKIINDLTNAIRSAALSPLSDRWWLDADEPMQFLAFCQEWTRYVDSGDDPAFISSLPVSTDGTCNGLQHFSAMLRDPIGGAAVNLVPMEAPQDIYDRICLHVLDQLEHIAVHGNTERDRTFASLWLSSKLVTRKLCKTPTMTFGYGSKPYGFQEQLSQFLQHKLGRSTEESQQKWNVVKLHFTLPNERKEGRLEVEALQACGFMSQRIWQALQQTVVAASQGMSWLQSAARVVLKNGKPMEWTVPVTNFPVKQEYFVLSKQQIHTMLAGRVVRPAVYTPTKVTERHKQVNGIAPNVVHSLDAAALMLTVTQAMNDGLESFVAIHDSFGTLAGDMGVLAAATRQSFLTLYGASDVVAKLSQQFAKQAPEGSVIPIPPPLGTLDISLIVASPYFFS